MADSKSKRDQDKAKRESEQDRTAAERERDEASDQLTEVQKNPDLDPNAPGIDDVERNRRREELAKRQG